MTDTPVVDGRDGEEVLEEVRELVPSYTDEWDPNSDDVGSALLTLFSSMAEDVIDRLDRVPDKHRIAFFDALGFDRKPPQPARLPVTFEVTDDVEGNVAIPEGTQAVAPAEGERPEQLFEIPDGGGFEGTPANVEAVYTVDPDADDVFDHWAALEGGTESRLFTGTDQQKHALNVGHADVLNLKAGSTIWVTVRTATANPGVFTKPLVWEFYGEVETDDGKEETWHELTAIEVGRKAGGTAGQPPARSVAIALRLPPVDPPGTEGGVLAAETKDREIGGIESRWIRCRVPTDEELEELKAEGEEYSPQDLFDVDVRSLTLSLVAPGDGRGDADGNGDGDGDGDGERGILPDDLLSGDVPLAVQSDPETPVDLYPFGETWPLRNTFYVDSEEVFTKGDVTVTLKFELPDGRGDLTFEDQLSDGSTVTVQAVSVPEELANGAFVVVSTSEETELEGGATTSVAAGERLGESERLDPGLHENVEVEFDDGTRLREGTGLTVELYRAANGEPGDPYEGSDAVTARVVLFDGGDPRVSWEYWNGEGWARLEDLEDETDNLTRSGTVTFTVPDDLEATTAAGHEGHWIRARVVNGEYVRLAYDAEVLQEGKVSTSVFGVAPHFGGVNLVYGSPDPVVDGDGSQEDTNGDSDPDTTKLPEHLVTLNNLDYSDDLVETLDSTASLSPFYGLPDESQTLYVGFDGRLHDGPINLLFSLADREYPDGFYPRVRWEYRSISGDDEWRTIDSEDGTESLTERGIVQLVFGDPTVESGRFGKELHWIRARLDGREFDPAAVGDDTDDPAALPVEIVEIDAETGLVLIANTSGQELSLDGYRIEFECAGPGDRLRTFEDDRQTPEDEMAIEPYGTFAVRTERKSGDYSPTFPFDEPPLDDRVPNAVTILAPDGEVVTRSVEGEVEPCEQWLDTVPPAGKPDESPPVVLGLHPNTGWAYNVETIKGEILGSSDGTPDQEFTVASPPVTEESVWVNELAALSEGERSELREADPTRVDEVTGTGDEPIAFWVRWTRVADFLDSNAADRHYRLDPTLGRFTFGNGIRGMILPRGLDNVRVDYRTGGGVAGNVDPGAVTDLVSTIPFVDAVTNPEPGDAGADGESVESVVARAPGELRDRGKAVTREDFERIAMVASRKLARARCIPSMDDSGEHRPGWVTVLIVPNDTRPKPVPSVELKRRVSEGVSEYAPATLVSHGAVGTGEEPTPAPELVVRGPSYVEVSVTTTVRAEGTVGSVSVLETRVTRGIDAFLHPLTGGETEDGWRFGELPCLSDLFALLEGVDGVDHVVDLSMTFAGGDDEITVTEGEESPKVAADVLPFGGTHTVEVDGANEITTTERS